MNYAGKGTHASRVRGGKPLILVLLALAGCEQKVQAPPGHGIAGKWRCSAVDLQAQKGQRCMDSANCQMNAEEYSNYKGYQIMSQTCAQTRRDP